MLEAGQASTHPWMLSHAALPCQTSAQLWVHCLLTSSDASLRMLSMRAGTLPASQVARHIMSTEACLQPDSQAVHVAIPSASTCLWQQLPGQGASWHKESVQA